MSGQRSGTGTRKPRTPLKPVSDKRAERLRLEGRRPGKPLASHQQIRPCGRRYGSEEAASRSKLAGKPGAVITECNVCDGWHIRFPDRARKPLQAVSEKRQQRGTQHRPAVDWKRIGSGLKPFPRAVQVQLNERDEWCQRCGRPGPLHKHHRRGKGSGSDYLPHAQCACNGIKMCLWCHEWAHRTDRREAEAQGFIVSQEVDLPGTKGVMRGAEDSGGVLMFPHCDGSWQSWPMEAEAA